MDHPESPIVPSVLVAPLDWGLGHATRCIPLIHELIRQEANVVLAGSGAVKDLLQKEFDGLRFIDLKGYNIAYSKSKWTLPFVMGSQIPKILSVIQYENEEIKAIVKTHEIDGIISDNRYGLYHHDLPSVFMTHQLLIKTGLGKTADGYLQSLNYRYIRHFSECWVPDEENGASLAGELSHPVKPPSVPLKYLGSLSRFTSSPQAESSYLLVVLSGPEPQRTIFEELLLEQLDTWHEPVVFVRGLPSVEKELYTNPNIRFYNHLPSKELNRLMNNASLIVSRCGYSTIMDLAALKKKSILVPTPGQTEQEYLGKHLMAVNFALSIEQDKFKLKAALDLAGNFPYRLNAFQNHSHLERAVRSFLYKIQFHIQNR